MKKLIIILSIISILSGCYDFTNPADSKSINYPGYPTIDSVADFAAVLPLDGSSSLTPPTKIVCAKLLGADIYHAQIAADNGFSDIIYEKADSPSNEFDTTSVDFTAGTFYIRFRVCVDNIWCDWTEDVLYIFAETIWSGRTPANGISTPEKTTFLDWDDVTEAVSYELQYALTDAGVSTSAVNTAPSSQYQIGSVFALGSTVYWRVRIVNEENIKGAWSYVWQFDIREPYIGESFAGGIVFYLDEEGGGLTAAESDQSTDSEWGGYGTIVGGTSIDVGTGAANTTTIVTALGSGTYAAKICADLVLNDYDDWFLPSKGELDHMYHNLYLQGFGGFVERSYWSSSEFSSDFRYYSWERYFKRDSLGRNDKYDGKHVRAIRAF